MNTVLLENYSLPTHLQPTLTGPLPPPYKQLLLNSLMHDCHKPQTYFSPCLTCILISFCNADYCCLSQTLLSSVTLALHFTRWLFFGLFFRFIFLYTDSWKLKLQSRPFYVDIFCSLPLRSHTCPRLQFSSLCTTHKFVLLA